MALIKKDTNNNSVICICFNKSIFFVPTTIENMFVTPVKEKIMVLRFVKRLYNLLKEIR